MEYWNFFASYKHPQKKITNLEQKGSLISLKGVYMLFPKVSEQLLSVELTTPYGTPCLDAIRTRYYGLIPESPYDNFINI